MKTLCDWDIQERVKTMSFDATTSNTGHLAGVCNLIKIKLRRDKVINDSAVRVQFSSVHTRFQM
jgi:hypothetical protein